MTQPTSRETRLLEIVLVITAIGMAALMFVIPGYKMVVLNMFYLPVVLSAFFLGRYRAGVLALLCIIFAAFVTVLDLAQFAALTSPTVVALGLTVWASVLGLTAILVGTLSDERGARLNELNEAYVGVIDVLSGYLHSANQKLRARSIRVADLSQRVALEMRLPPREIDNIRVAALLHDIENLEITAKVIEKAVGSLEENDNAEHTFPGTDLAQSLGGVLTGAFPLLVRQNDRVHNIDSENSSQPEIPVGARIIRAVRAFDTCVHEGHKSEGDETTLRPVEAIELLRGDTAVGYDAAVLNAIERAVPQNFESIHVADDRTPLYR